MTDTALKLAITAAMTTPSGTVNDDAIGHRGDVAWVFDGATDLLAEPLVAADSDAAWLAATLSARLAERADSLPGADLAGVLDDLTRHAAAAFARLTRRQPTDRFEHPSAAGLIVRLSGAELHVLAVGDCTLLAAPPGGQVTRYGIEDDDAGDPWVGEHIAAAGPAPATTGAGGLRENLLPFLRQGRDRLNLVPGYGVFSITPPPAEYVVSARLPVAPGTRLLLASDGFMRLTDVYRLLTLEDLFAETYARGVPAMLDLLRRTEAQDAACARWPRAKVSDDASVILATVEAR